MKILAVDDDSFILELLSMMAARVGFPDVSTAQSGEIALDLLNGGPNEFDCLLLDISMPEMDGIELCRRIRALPAYRKTPIIMLTAMAESDYIDHAFKAGATDYANKPFDIMELGARLRMAQEVVTARQEAKFADAAPGDDRSGPPRENAFGLSDGIRIEGMEELVDYVALGNYLTQLSRAGMGGSQVIAVRIDRIEEIHARSSTDEFTYALSEVADAIGAAFRTSGYLMSYAGKGTFVVIAHKANLEPSITLETEIQNFLDEKDMEYDNGNPLDIEVSLGNPIRPSLNRMHPVRKTFERAIARAENRAVKKMNEPRQVNIRIIGG